MKKYIITASDIRRIKKCRDVQGAWTALNALTPIEPLSERQILKAIQSCGQELHGRIALTYESGPYDIDTPTVVATNFVRAIERHIVGSETQ